MTPVAGAPGAPAALRPQAGWRVEAFHYHIMRLRHGGRSAAVRDGGVIYPDDLTDMGGPVMTSEASYNIYVNCPGAYASCWGKVEAFQQQLKGSSFAGLLTQYTNSATSLLTLAGSTSVSYKRYHGTALYENDLFAILHGVVAKRGKAGYGNLYHIFLPKGTDTCFYFSRSCYSPDYRPTNNFCAYHATVKFGRRAGRLFGRAVPGRRVLQDGEVGGGERADVFMIAISTLAHEVFESITDPGPKLAWINDITYEEVADECQFYVSNVTLASTAYHIQPMYSNAVHACATK